jgi:hypothetical protein
MIVSSRLHFSFSALIAITLNILNFGVKADGVAFKKEYSNEKPELWEPVPFKSYERFGFSISVRTHEDQTVVITNDKLGMILEQPQFAEMTLVTEADWEKLAQASQSWQERAAQLPQIKKLILTVLSGYDAILQHRGSGKIYIRGKWMEKEEYAAYINSFSRGSSAIPELRIEDKVYRNVKVSSAKDGRLGITHDGGVARIMISDLSESQITILKSASPSVFEKYLEETTSESQKSTTAQTIPNDQTQPPKGQRKYLDAIEQSERDRKINKLNGQIEFLNREYKITKRTVLPELINMTFDKAMAEGLTNAVRDADAIVDSVPRLDIDNQVSYLEFKVVKKLDKKSFRGVSASNGNTNVELYEIILVEDDMQALLVTVDTTFESTGLSMLPLFERERLDVQLVNGFDTNVMVFEEADALTKQKMADLLEAIRDGEKKMKDARATALVDLKSKLAQILIPGSSHQPLFNLSNGLKAKGFKAQISSATFDQLQKSIANEDWSMIHAKVRAGNFLHMGSSMPQPGDSSSTIVEVSDRDRKLEDFDNVIESLKQAKWPIALQSSMTQTWVKNGELYLSDTAFGSAQTCIGVLTLPMRPQSLVIQNEGSGASKFTNLKLEDIYAQSLSVHPSGSGIMHWAGLDGRVITFFVDNSAQAVRDEGANKKLKLRIDELNTQINVAIEQYEVNQDGAALDRYIIDKTLKFCEDVTNFVLVQF